MRYFIYCRKSSEEEERQALSIESQLIELREYAQKEKLFVVREFCESKSAKTLGRPVFEEMIQALEKGEADGIVAWAPDRISRNSVDGGKVIYLVDQGLIKDLKFPTYFFDSSPHGKFNLSIAFGQAKLYTDAMKENIMRGIRQKLRRGEFPGLAPIGYFNHHKTRKIEPDLECFDLVQNLLEKFAAGEIGQAGIREELFKHGIKSKKGGLISFSVIENMLKNVFYYGYFIFAKELHKGSHKAMITKDTYDRIQKRLEKNPKKLNFHNHVDKEKNFLFPGIARCGECGYAVTKEWHQKKSGKVFKYYRCSKRSPSYKCQQKPINEKDMIPQVEELISLVSIDQDVYELFSSLMEKDRSESEANAKEQLAELGTEVDRIKVRLQNLLDLQLDGEISLQEYKIKKNELTLSKADLEARISKIVKEGGEMFEPLANFIETSYQAGLSLKDKNYSEMTRILKKVGLNPTLEDKKLSVSFLGPFNFLIEHHSMTSCGSIADEKCIENNQRTQLKSSVYSGVDASKASRRCYTAGSEWHAKHAGSCASSTQCCEPEAYEVRMGEWCVRKDLNLYFTKMRCIFARDYGGFTIFI